MAAFVCVCVCVGGCVCVCVRACVHACVCATLLFTVYFRFLVWILCGKYYILTSIDFTGDIDLEIFNDYGRFRAVIVKVY